MNANECGPGAHQASVSERVTLALAAADAVRGAAKGAALTEASQALLRQVVSDAAVRVRQTFAEAVKNLPALPLDISLALARDFESIALPILEHSPTLTTPDLVALVDLGTVPKQVAIAKRAGLEGPVVEAIIRAGHVEVVAALLENLSVSLPAHITHRIEEEFGHVDYIERALIQRSDLPADLASRLAWASLPSVERVANGARDRRIADVIGKPEHALREIVKAVIAGDHLFATETLAQLSNLSEQVVATLLCDRGLVGARALLRRAGLDLRYAGILTNAVAMLREIGFGIELEDRAPHARRCLLRLMTGEHALFEDQRAELEMWLAGLAPVPARPSAQVQRLLG